jgi:hypothetical protein
VQESHAHIPSFVHSGVGVDPIIGALAGAQRVVNGLDPTDSTKSTTLTTGKSSLPSLKFYTDCAIQTLLFRVVESTSSRLRCLPFPASSRFDSTARHSVPAMLVQTATLFLRRRVHARTRDSFDVIIILGYCRYWVDRIKFEINAKFSRVACHIRLLDLP